METVKNLNRKIKPSATLLEVINFNYVWEEYYTLNANTAICWWWHGFARNEEEWAGTFIDGKRVFTRTNSGAAYFSAIKIENDIVSFWGEEYLGARYFNDNEQEQWFSDFNLVPNKEVAEYYYKELTDGVKPEVKGLINGETYLERWETTQKTLTAIFYTLT